MSEELRFEVRKVDPPLTISQHQKQEAHRLADLNNEANELDLYFKPSWIRSYVSVEIVAIHQGKQRKAVGKNDILTQEQKEIIQHADAGTPIAAHIQYLPENTLSHNDVKSLDFEVNVKPFRDARYPGGQQKMKDYLASNAVDKIPEGIFQPTDFAAVQFTINESGVVVDAKVFESAFQLHPHDSDRILSVIKIWDMGLAKTQQSYNFQIGLSIEKFGQLRLLFLLHSNRFA